MGKKLDYLDDATKHSMDAVANFGLAYFFAEPAYQELVSPLKVTDPKKMQPSSPVF